MASINIRKLHGEEAAAILNHTHRHDGRPGVEYGNCHIDPARSSLNSVLVPRGIGRETAAEELARLRARVAEIDAAEPPKRIRRDRVTLVSVEIPAPAGLPPEQEEAFFRLACAEVAKMAGGAKNVGSIQIHRDEVHEYTDPVTRERRTSRVHAHMLCIPYVAGRGVNCKQWMSRDRLRQIQRAVDSRCRQKLGRRYLDGSGQKSRGTVEDLKIASARVESEARELAKIEREQEEVLISAQESLTAIEGRLEALRAEAAELQDALPLVRHVGLVAEILDELDGDLADELRRILADAGVHPDDPGDQRRLADAVDAVERASRRARRSARGRDDSLDR